MELLAASPERATVSEGMQQVLLQDPKMQGQLQRRVHIERVAGPAASSAPMSSRNTPRAARCSPRNRSVHVKPTLPDLRSILDVTDLLAVERADVE